MQKCHLEWKGRGGCYASIMGLEMYLYVGGITRTGTYSQALALQADPGHWQVQQCLLNNWRRRALYIFGACWWHVHHDYVKHYASLAVVYVHYAPLRYHIKTLLLKWCHKHNLTNIHQLVQFSYNITKKKHFLWPSQTRRQSCLLPPSGERSIHLKAKVLRGRVMQKRCGGEKCEKR